MQLATLRSSQLCLLHVFAYGNPLTHCQIFVGHGSNICTSGYHNVPKEIALRTRIASQVLCTLRVAREETVACGLRTVYKSVVQACKKNHCYFGKLPFCTCLWIPTSCKAIRTRSSKARRSAHLQGLRTPLSIARRYMKNTQKEPQSIAHERPIWRQPGAPTLPLKEQPEPRQLVRQKVEPKGGPKR